MSAQYATRDGVAVITIDNPPVNGLGHATRTAIAEGIARAEADPAITAIVLTGGGKVFSGGADIREFNTPKTFEPPSLRDLIGIIESSRKPVVAAIHGVAMGGGLELALGCHYRVAATSAQVALPEVKLGLLPGAGGTQRLPRVVGLDMALAMITSGDARRADAVPALFALTVEGDLVQGAVSFARDVAAGTQTHARVRDIAMPERDAAAFRESALATLPKALRARPAPVACVEALAATLTHSFDEGLRIERAEFDRLMVSPESKALRHVFFAERAATRIADVPSDTPARKVEKVAVIGAGTMGTGIAMCFLGAGMPVRLVDTSVDALERGVATIVATYEASVAKGKLDASEAARRRDRLQPSLAMDDIADADLVVEAVFEDMAVKSAVFREIDRVAKPRAILASNTSTLDLDRLAQLTGRPGDVVGLHFFSPANVMRLLEVVRGAATSADVLATAMKLGGRIGKIPVVARVCDGFIGNRMIAKYLEQAYLLLLEGALPQDVDRAIEGFGFAMGPFRMSDVAGNDISWAIRKRRYEEHGNRGHGLAADRLCELGRFGQKTGAGWYDYAAGSRSAQPSPVVNDMLRSLARSGGTGRDDLTEDEIVQRLVWSLVNEGAQILDEGIAARASDIDVVYVTGYGFPRHLGGPMFHADQVGLPAVAAAIARFAQGPHGDAWRAAPLLTRLAAEGRAFTA